MFEKIKDELYDIVSDKVSGHILSEIDVTLISEWVISGIDIDKVIEKSTNILVENIISDNKIKNKIEKSLGKENRRDIISIDDVKEYWIKQAEKYIDIKTKELTNYHWDAREQKIWKILEEKLRKDIDKFLENRKKWAK